MLADFGPKYPSTRAYFPSERRLATPKVRIPPAPPRSPPDFGHFGESLEIRVCARFALPHGPGNADVGARRDPQTGPRLDPEFGPDSECARRNLRQNLCGKFGATVWAGRGTELRPKDKHSIRVRTTAPLPPSTAEAVTSRGSEGTSARHVENGICSLGFGGKRLDGFIRRQNQQVDSSAVRLEFHLVHHRKRSISSRADYEALALPGYLFRHRQLPAALEK